MIKTSIKKAKVSIYLFPLRGKTQQLVESEAFPPSDTDFTIKFGFRVHFGALFGLFWRRRDTIFKICVTQTSTVTS